MQQPDRQSFLSRYNAFFLTGTDTGVGKTTVACALALYAQAQGLDWRYFKPAESGADSDAGAVARATGAPERVTVGYRLAAPLAPAFAAELEGKVISLAHLDAQFQNSAGAPRIVEGAGGLLVPYAAGVFGADLAARWRLPLLVVVANRLGCLNHALLTIETARTRGLEVAGCVFNDLGNDPSKARNVADFQRLSTIPVLAWLRSLPSGGPTAEWWSEGIARVP